MSAGLPTAEETARVLGELFSHMGYGARLDVRDAEDGSLSVAVTLDAELPAAQGGRRSSVLEAVQYLVNKRLNRAPDVRRWINLGLGEHPAPRAPRAPRPAQESPAAAAPVAVAPAAPAPASAPKKAPAPAAKPARAAPLDESRLEVTPDETLAASARALAEAAARLGRTYALVGMSAEDRARVVQAARGTEGVAVKTEGEGRNRRVSLVPDKPTPMPRQRLPGLDDEAFDDEDEADEG